MTEHFDVAIIGGGTGGLIASDAAKNFGLKVALIEKSRIGGDCTWTGCVPSKALVQVAKVAHHTRTAGEYGLIANPPQVDMTKVRDYVTSAIEDAARSIHVYPTYGGSAQLLMSQVASENILGGPTGSIIKALAG